MQPTGKVEVATGCVRDCQSRQTCPRHFSCKIVHVLFSTQQHCWCMKLFNSCIAHDLLPKFLCRCMLMKSFGHETNIFLLCIVIYEQRWCVVHSSYDASISIPFLVASSPWKIGGKRHSEIIQCPCQNYVVIDTYYTRQYYHPVPDSWERINSILTTVAMQYKKFVLYNNQCSSGTASLNKVNSESFMTWHLFLLLQ